MIKASAIKGKGYYKVCQLYVDRISFLSAAFVSEKPLTNFDSYMGIELINYWSLQSNEERNRFRFMKLSIPLIQEPKINSKKERGHGIALPRV